MLTTRDRRAGVSHRAGASPFAHLGKTRHRPTPDTVSQKWTNPMPLTPRSGFVRDRRTVRQQSATTPPSMAQPPSAASSTPATSGTAKVLPHPRPGRRAGRVPDAREPALGLRTCSTHRPGASTARPTHARAPRPPPVRTAPSQVARTRAGDRHTEPHRPPRRLREKRPRPRRDRQRLAAPARLAHQPDRQAHLGGDRSPAPGRTARRWPSAGRNPRRSPAARTPTPPPSSHASQARAKSDIVNGGGPGVGSPRAGPRRPQMARLEPPRTRRAVRRRDARPPAQRRSPSPATASPRT